jgi:hypothetical protein
LFLCNRRQFFNLIIYSILFHFLPHVSITGFKLLIKLKTLC